MKKWVLIVAVALGAAVVFYQSHGQTVAIRSHVDDGVVDTAQIVQAIDAQLSNLAAGIANRDAQLIFGIFGDPDTARYVRDGSIYESIAAAEEAYARRFAKQDTAVERKFEFRRKEYDIINPSTVLFTGIGELTARGPDVDETPWVIAYTILWVSDADGWSAINMHISWE